MIKTKDPNIFIIEKSNDRVVYQNTTGETWEIIGICNMCGLCEVGGKDDKIVWLEGILPGTPGACYHIDREHRLDNPVRPEIKYLIPECTLSGRYL